MIENAKLLKIIELQNQIAREGCELSNVIDLVTREVPKIVACDGVAVEMHEHNKMVYRSTSGMAECYLGLKLDSQSSLSGFAVDTGESQLCRDIEEDSRVDREACYKIGLRSMAVIPLQFENASVGVLKVMSAQVNKFSRGDIESLELITEALSSAMFFASRYTKADIQFLSTHDMMTNLVNRSIFMERLRHLQSRRRAHDHQFAIMFVTVNGLSKINEDYGNAVGDDAIKEVANSLNTATRTTDLVARYSGDEFAIILAPLETSDTVLKIKQRIEQQMSLLQLSYKDDKIQLSCSLGYAVFPDDHDDYERLIDIADERMNVNKKRFYKEKYLNFA